MSEGHYEFFDGSGYTSKIFRIPGTRKVVKSFFPECLETHFLAEKQAYERFSTHKHPSSILKYYGVDENDSAGLVLELAEKRNLYDYVWDAERRGHEKSRGHLYRWARQAAEGLAFAHSCGVIHSDVHCVNLLLDENLDLKVADWAGASIDGSRSYSCYRTTHSLLKVQGKGSRPSVQSDIFGLGSALHNMIVGHDVFPELDYEKDKDEIVRRLRDKEFPDTSKFPALGEVVLNCWKLQYETMRDVGDAIEAGRNQYESSMGQILDGTLRYEMDKKTQQRTLFINR